MPEQAKIPEYLGKCEVLKVHDDGDLSIKCAGKKYVVTTEGEVFKEYSAKQCILDEFDEILGRQKEMSGEELQEAFRKAVIRCVGGK